MINVSKENIKRCLANEISTIDAKGKLREEPTHALYYAFIWGITPQGHHFWANQAKAGKLNEKGRAILTAQLNEMEKAGVSP